MTHTYYIPSRFHAGHSLLGRWLCRRVGDARRAEAYHILILTGAALLLLLAHAITRALLPATGGPAAWWRWGGEAAFLLVVFGMGVWGRRPATVISCEPEALRIEQGQRTLVLPCGAIEAVETITPLRYHRHEQRYAATHAFVGRLDHDLLLLKTARGPVVLGLQSDDHTGFRACLDRARAASSLARDMC